jgi:hypothetical protein
MPMNWAVVSVVAVSQGLKVNPSVLYYTSKWRTLAWSNTLVSRPTGSPTLK